MATPITWRDIKAPDFGRANSLISGATNTFNNAFLGLDKLQKNQQAVQAQAQLEQEQQAANAVFGQILGGANPNEVNPSFAGLGSQGAGVASFLQDSRNNFFTNQANQASTTGQTNINGAFTANNQAGLNEIKSGIDFNTAKIGLLDTQSEGNTTRNRFLEKQLQQELDLGKANLTGKKETNRRVLADNNAEIPFLDRIAKDKSVISGNNAVDSTTISQQLDKQLAGARGLVNAQASNQRASASFSRRRSAGGSSGGRSGKGSSGGGNFALALARVNDQLQSENLKQGTSAYAERGRQLLAGFTGGSTAAALQNSLFSVNKKTGSGNSDVGGKFKIPEFTTGNGLDGKDTGEFNKLGDLIRTGGTFKDGLGITREFTSKDARAAAGRALKNLNAERKDDIFYTFNGGIKSQLDAIRNKYTQPRVDRTKTKVAPPPTSTKQTAAQKARTSQITSAVLKALKERANQ